MIDPIERVADPDIPKESEAMVHLLETWSVEQHVIEQACKIVEGLADEAMRARDNWQEAEREAARLKGRLNFHDLRRANVDRCEDVFHKVDDWSPTDWATAVGGETGEAADALGDLISTAYLGLKVAGKSGQASNAVKKVKRGDGKVEDVGKELADMVIYADLLATRLGIDLAAAIIEKFNEVSEKRNSQIRL